MAVITATAAGTLVGTAGIASAATAVPVITGTNTTTGTPALPTYTDQQVVEVSAAANTTFTQGTTLTIEECADTGGTIGNLPTSNATCDGNTAAGDTIFVGAGGAFDYVAGGGLGGGYSGFTVQVDSGAVTCNTTHACVLYIGTDDTNFSSPKVFSNPFYVAASGPPPVTPETPYAVILPIAAGGIVVGAILFASIRRRRQGAES
jgi:hypothetical protein